jgi:hypothetical protein
MEITHPPMLCWANPLSLHHSNCQQGLRSMVLLPSSANTSSHNDATQACGHPTSLSSHASSHVATFANSLPPHLPPHLPTHYSFTWPTLPMWPYSSPISSPPSSTNKANLIISSYPCLSSHDYTSPSPLPSPQGPLYNFSHTTCGFINHP